MSTDKLAVTDKIFSKFRLQLKFVFITLSLV